MIVKFWCISIFLFGSSVTILVVVDAQFEDYCIADEQYTDDELKGAMKWACDNGADCRAIEAYQPCFFPNTTKDHASYAFNSYYQNMKHNGGSCYFIAASVLTALNPSKKFFILLSIIDCVVCRIYMSSLPEILNYISMSIHAEAVSSRHYKLTNYLFDYHRHKKSLIESQSYIWNRKLGAHKHTHTQNEREFCVLHDWPNHIVFVINKGLSRSFQILLFKLFFFILSWKMKTYVFRERENAYKMTRIWKGNVRLVTP